MSLDFTAGRIPAAQLRARLPLVGVVSADIAIASFTDLTDVPGLSVYLEAGRAYGIDGYISYTASGDGMMKISLQAPPGAGMDWSIFPLAAGDGSTDGIGTIEGIGKRGWGDSWDQGAAGGTAVWCPLTAMIVTSRWSGPLQVRFAQIASNTSSTMIRAGSWIRAERIA